MHQNIC